MAQDILITPGSGEPQILFRGSGVNDSPIQLNVMSSYESATGSGTALLFEGEEGLLFGITDNLSSGTIFSVSDITGLPALEYNASGELKIGEYASSTTLYSDQGIYLTTGIPTTTTRAIYDSGNALHYNGSAVNDPDLANYSNTNSKFVESDNTGITGADEVTNIVALTQAEYDALGSKSATTLYFIYS
jgi:hypothetical protein